MGGATEMLLAQVATLDPSTSGVWERLGVAGILVVASYFLLRYFIGELARKDDRLNEMGQQFIDTMKEFGDLAREAHRQQSETTMALRELKDFIGNNWERRSRTTRE